VIKEIEVIKEVEVIKEIEKEIIKEVEKEAEKEVQIIEVVTEKIIIVTPTPLPPTPTPTPTPLPPTPTPTPSLHPSIERVDSNSHPPIPSGFIKSCWIQPYSGPESPTCPVLKWNDITYWPYNFSDNRVALGIVAYYPNNKPWYTFQISGVRSIYDITHDIDNRTLTFIDAVNNRAKVTYTDMYQGFTGIDGTAATSISSAIPPTPTPTNQQTQQTVETYDALGSMNKIYRGWLNLSAGVPSAPLITTIYPPSLHFKNGKSILNEPVSFPLDEFALTLPSGFGGNVGWCVRTAASTDGICWDGHPSSFYGGTLEIVSNSESGATIIFTPLQDINAYIDINMLFRD